MKKRIKKSVIVTALLFLLPSLYLSSGYCYAYEKNNHSYKGSSFTIYKLSRERIGGKRVCVKYFAKNAYENFNTWRINKQVIIACSGAFSVGWDVNSPPYGLCIDNGIVVNRNLAISQDKNGNSLDGLVIVYNGGDDAGGIVVKDIEKGQICTKFPQKCYDIKNNFRDKNLFIKWAVDNNATVFQMPIMYSYEYEKNFGVLNYGDKKERRFLAICKNGNGIIYHLIINVRDKNYMNASAQTIISFLKQSYTIIYAVLVLDTGSKDILYEYEGANVFKIGNTEIDQATNLLVYYFE